jgi:hypothetical protein
MRYRPASTVPGRNRPGLPGPLGRVRNPAAGTGRVLVASNADPSGAPQ